MFSPSFRYMNLDRAGRMTVHVALEDFRVKGKSTNFPTFHGISVLIVLNNA